MGISAADDIQVVDIKRQHWREQLSENQVISKQRQIYVPCGA
jgi:hypothetical protein